MSKDFDLACNFAFWLGFYRNIFKWQRDNKSCIADQIQAISLGYADIV